MNKSFIYKLYPNSIQEKALLDTLNTHRHLYNNALSERKSAYEINKTSILYLTQQKNLSINRKNCPYLSQCNVSSLQRTLRKLDQTYTAFFTRIKKGEKAGYPRFKSKNQFNSFVYTYNPLRTDGCKITPDNKLYIQFIGNIKVKLYKPVEGVIKTLTIRRKLNDWYAIFSCELPDIKPIPSNNPPVGIDLGLKSFLTTSDGTEVKPPKFYRKAQKKLRRLQRSVSRKKKGSSSHKKSITILAKCHNHIANQRKDFHHKTARNLINNYGVIVHEKLQVKNMIQFGNLAKSINDAGWNSFISILKHKAESAGVQIIEVNSAYTSQICSKCGFLPTVKLTLKDRIYNCEHCNLNIDRDYNAAINILNRAGIPPLDVNQIQ